jgi:4-hydroxy-4-methyl-2-oxoglutarate aldolase
MNSGDPIMPVIVKNFERPDSNLVSAFSEIGVATIHECIGKETNNAMDYAIKPIERGMKLAGPAVTVDSFLADNITVHVAMTLCKPGDILVVNGHGMPGVMFGGQMATQSMEHKIGGIVVDGAVRDSQEIRKIGFPCFAKIISPIGSAKSTPGSINIPIHCGGVLVTPGDVIVGDDDGVVVVPRKQAREVLEKARKRLEKEEKDRELYRKGMTSAQMNEFDKILKAKGVREVEKLEDL